jgi:hypothetical protein
MAETTIQKLVSERNHWMHRNEKLQAERKLLKAAYKELQHSKSTKHQIEWYVSTAIAAHEMQLQQRSRTTTMDSAASSSCSRGEEFEAITIPSKEEEEAAPLECNKSIAFSEIDSVVATPKPLTGMGRVGFGSCGALGFTHKQRRWDTSVTEKQPPPTPVDRSCAIPPQEERPYEPLQLIARTNSHDSSSTSCSTASSSKKIKARKHHLFSPQQPQTPAVQVPLIHANDFLLSPEEEQDTTTCPISSVSSWKGEDSLYSYLDSPGLSLHHSPSANSWQAEITCDPSVLRSLAIPNSQNF